MPDCHFTHAGTRLLRLRHYAQLLLQTPATTTFPPANDLNSAVQHRLKLDLTERFKVDSSAHPSASEKAGLTRRLPFTVIRSLPHGHAAAALGTARKVGLDRILGPDSDRCRDLILALLVGRILDPASKLATARALSPATAASSLGELLGLGEVDEDELYHALDWLLEHQPAIEATLAKRHLTNGTLVLYDVSSSYMEGRCCPLAKRGYSRDGKKGTLQIVYGLLCAPDGCPIAIEVFEGNTADPMTLATQIEKLKQRFNLDHVVLVGDRGMITQARITEDIKSAGLDWISSLRAPAIRELVEGGVLQLSLFDQRDMASITAPDFPGERLVVCRNPDLAAQRTRKREDLLAATERDLARSRQPWRASGIRCAAPPRSRSRSAR